MNVTQLIHRNANRYSNLVGSIQDTKKETWSELKDDISKIAAVFKGLNLPHDGRVAILSLNSSFYFKSYFAVPWADGIIVPLNIRLAPPELIYMLNDSGTEILIVDDAFAAMLPHFENKLETVKHIIFTGKGETPENAINIHEAIKKNEAIADAERGEEELFGIIYTGGTTGLPKGVMLSHDNVMSNMVSMMTTVQIVPHPVYLHAAPMFHMADFVGTMITTAKAGTHTYIPKFDVLETLEIIAKEKVNMALFIPTMINLMVNAPKFEDYDTTSLEMLLYGGSPMPVAVIEQCIKSMPQSRLIQAYGMTETSPLQTVLQHEDHLEADHQYDRRKSGGQPILGVQIKIVDENNVEVENGTVGEIKCKGPNVMKGYWNKKEETDCALKDGWMHTGDGGFMDDEEYVYIVDRKKDMIICGGENVYSTEVENAIYQHPAIALCGVVGIPSEEWGEAVHAIVNVKENQTVSEGEIIEHCKKLIANYKCPKSVEIREEPLPISGAGKILKTELRKPFWEGQSRDVS